MGQLIITVIKCGAALVLGIIAGNGAVYFFNKMPGSWLCDYGETPGEELLHPTEQRIKSYPWKWFFSMLFIVLAIKLFMADIRFGAAALIAIWTLLEMSVADIKYMIVPDQLIILMTMTAVGFIPFHNNWTDCLAGGLFGFGVMLLTAFIGKLAYRRDAMGGGDIKLFAGLGIILGLAGIITVFILTTLLSAGHFAVLLATKKIKKGDYRPMVPYIAVSATIYMLFLWSYGQTIWL